MSKLRRRIINQAAGPAAAQGTYHPYGTPDTPMVMPMVLVQFGPGGGAAVEQMVPLITANGAAIPATAPGRYGQVVVSSRPSR